MTLTFEQLRKANSERCKVWDPKKKLNLYFKALELAGETGETCNKIKKLWREELGIGGSKTSLAELYDELADIIICTDLVADELNIDLGEVVRSKFNTTSIERGFSQRL